MLKMRLRRPGGRLVVVGLFLLVASGICGSSAQALAPYGQLSSFGGFDSTGKTSGKFVNPVGFAVDPDDAEVVSDNNAVYVLDNTSLEEAGENLRVGYRLQKLDSKGDVLGTASFTEEFAYTETLSNAHPPISLAVDSAAHRVYTVFQDVVSDGQGRSVPVAGKLEAWSTKPNSSKVLVAAEESSGHPYATIDPVSKAAVVSGPSVLEPAAVSKDLFATEGIAVDPSTHDVVIEAQQGPNDTGSGPVGGATILQRVVTQGVNVGKLGASWSADTTTAPSEDADADGIFATATGGFGVHLYSPLGAESDRISRIAEIGADFASPDPQVITPFVGESPQNLDEAPGLDGQHAIAGELAELTDIDVLLPASAGTPVVQLSDGTTYAAIYAHKGEDPQADQSPWNTFTPNPFTEPFWSLQHQVNVGVRLFNAGGALLGTLGGGSGSCDFGVGALALAAGHDGTLFVLDQDKNSLLEGTSGRQVVEFGPGGTGCPQPSGTFSVNNDVVHSEVSVQSGAPVAFDASTIDRSGETPFEIDWKFGSATTGGPGNDGYTVVSKIGAPGFSWPSPTATNTFSTPGVYPVTVRVVGDYGTSTFSRTVKVVATEAEQAIFSVEPTSVTVGGTVSVDASASKASPGASGFDEYSWNFGDGSPTDEIQSSPQDTHVYTQAGVYGVTLTVTDSLHHKVTSAPQTVTVSAPPPACEAGCPATSCGSTCPPSTTSTVASTPVVTPPPVSIDKSTPNAAPKAVGGVTAQGALSVSLSCPAGKASCSGTVTLKTASAVAAKKQSKKKPSKKVLTLGSASFSLSGGARSTVVIHLSSAGLALLRKEHRLPVIATVVERDSYGDTGTSQLHLTLAAPAKAKKGAHGKH